MMETDNYYDQLDNPRYHFWYCTNHQRGVTFVTQGSRGVHETSGRGQGTNEIIGRRETREIHGPDCCWSYRGYATETTKRCGACDPQWFAGSKWNPKMFPWVIRRLDGRKENPPEWLVEYFK